MSQNLHVCILHVDIRGQQLSAHHIYSRQRLIAMPYRPIRRMFTLRTLVTYITAHVTHMQVTYVVLFIGLPVLNFLAGQISNAVRSAFSANSSVYRVSSSQPSFPSTLSSNSKFIIKDLWRINIIKNTTGPQWNISRQGRWKIQNLSCGPAPSPVTVNGNTIDPVQEFTYLGSIQSSNSNSTSEYIRHIGLAAGVAVLKSHC